jgi:hypothetical protein
MLVLQRGVTEQSGGGLSDPSGASPSVREASEASATVDMIDERKM